MPANPVASPLPQQNQPPPWMSPPGMAPRDMQQRHVGPRGMPPPGALPPGMRPPGMPPPGMPQPGFFPREAQTPTMSNTITLSVTGLNDQASGKAFGDKLDELVKRVSGGYQISGSGGGGRSTYTISMVNSIDVKAFADQITWAKVSRISGQTITIDASAQSND